MKDNCYVDINPDVMSIDEIEKLRFALEGLQDYLKQKKCAIEHRLAGSINAALVYEKRCDFIYKKLPECVKTW